MAHVKLILLEDVESLGLAGDEVSVSPGYARNYLLPKEKAIPVSAAATRMFQARKAKIEEKRQQAIAEAKEMAEKIGQVEVSISMEATADDSLFGSVTARVIADALKEKGVDIPHNRIQLLEPLKRLGAYDIQVHLGQNIVTSIKVWIVRA